MKLLGFRNMQEKLEKNATMKRIWTCCERFQTNLNDGNDPASSAFWWLSRGWTNRGDRDSVLAGSATIGRSTVTTCILWSPRGGVNPGTRSEATEATGNGNILTGSGFSSRNRTVSRTWGRAGGCRPCTRQRSGVNTSRWGVASEAVLEAVI